MTKFNPNFFIENYLSGLAKELDSDGIVVISLQEESLRVLSDIEDKQVVSEILDTIAQDFKEDFESEEVEDDTESEDTAQSDGKSLIEDELDEAYHEALDVLVDMGLSVQEARQTLDEIKELATALAALKR